MKMYEGDEGMSLCHGLEVLEVVIEVVGPDFDDVSLGVCFGISLLIILGVGIAGAVVFISHGVISYDYKE